MARASFSIISLSQRDMVICLSYYVIALFCRYELKPPKDLTLLDSYRPIALAPNLSKILERCILQT